MLFLRQPPVKWRPTAIAVCLAAVLSSATASAQDFGINSRTSNTSLLIPTLPPPSNLSSMAALLNAGKGIDQTGAGIIPFEPSAKLWSDGALKERYIAIPGLGTITYTADGGWGFPDGTVLIKNFLLPLDFRNPVVTAKRIETRLLIKNSGVWSGFSYEWNEAETDAALLPAGKNRAFTLIDQFGASYNYSWRYPSRTECTRCHTNATGRVAGITTPQMNSNFHYPASGVTDNQIRTFEHIGMFSSALPAPPSQLPSAPDQSDTTATTVQRAEAYLLANCSMCHRPGGPTPVNMDFRWGIPLADRNIYNVTPDELSETFGTQDPKRFGPGDPLESFIHWRMLTLGAYRMPPLATSRVDADADDLIMAWIKLMTTTDGPNNIWVDFIAAAPEFGTLDEPFNTVAEGVKNVTDGGTITLTPGNSSETITITKAVTLESTGGVVRIGVP